MIPHHASRPVEELERLLWSTRPRTHKFTLTLQQLSDAFRKAYEPTREELYMPRWLR